MKKKTVKEKREKFWLVWNPEGRAPTVKHHSRQLATQEAERLARANFGLEFLIFESVGGKKVELPMDDIPF